MQPALEEARRCPDCGSAAFPEEDGQARYWSCSACEYEFGWTLTGQADACSIGVPAPLQVRPGPAPVFLGTIGRRPS